MTYLRREFPIGTMLVGNFRRSVMHVHASCRLSVPVGTGLVPTPDWLVIHVNHRNTSIAGQFGNLEPKIAVGWPDDDRIHFVSDERLKLINLGCRVAFSV